MRRQPTIPALLLLSVMAPMAAAQTSAGVSQFTTGGFYQPQVPVSAFARPASWLDMSRLHVSTSVTVGSGFSGRTEGLQVTRLNYQFGAPISMSVGVGTAFGASSAARNGSPFLESLDLAYQPFRSMLIQVQYRDIRSPLQLSPNGYEYTPWR